MARAVLDLLSLLASLETGYPARQGRVLVEPRQTRAIDYGGVSERQVSLPEHVLQAIYTDADQHETQNPETPADAWRSTPWLYSRKAPK